MAVLGASGPAAIVLGGGLALSSTAVAMQARPRRTPAMPPCVMARLAAACHLPRLSIGKRLRPWPNPQPVAARALISTLRHRLQFCGAGRAHDPELVESSIVASHAVQALPMMRTAHTGVRRCLPAASCPRQLKRGRGRAQVLQDRSETGSRHGRATFAVLLFQVALRPARPAARVCRSCACHGPRAAGVQLRSLMPPVLFLSRMGALAGPARAPRHTLITCIRWALGGTFSCIFCPRAHRGGPARVGPHPPHPLGAPWTAPAARAARGGPSPNPGPARARRTWRSWCC